MANPTDFLLNTDYEMDKIIYFYEGSFNITNNRQTETIVHDLGFAPLCFGLWSTTKDFSQPHRMSGQGHGIYNLDTQSYTSTFATLLSSDYTEAPGSTYDYAISIDFTQMSGTIYVRIYGFEPTYVFKHIASTSGHANTFILNTDYNYRKLLKKGHMEIPHISGLPYGNRFDPVTVSHNLGYIPQVMLWLEERTLDENYQETDKNIQYIGYASLKDQLNDNSLDGAVLDTKNLTYYAPGGSQTAVNRYLHYRIYYDKAQ